MSGTTPSLLIPYPTGTDLVKDGDNAMEALARKTEKVIGGRNQGVTTPGTMWGSVWAAGQTTFTMATGKLVQTSNGNGQVAVNLTGVSGIGYAHAQPYGGQNQEAVMYVLDEVNTGPTALIFYVYSPAGVLLPNRSCKFTAFAVGWGTVP
jgi:hypothetical protein